MSEEKSNNENSRRKFIKNCLACTAGFAVLGGLDFPEKLFAQKRAEFYKRSLPFTEELLALIYASAKRTVEWTMDWREARDLKQRWKLEGQ